MRVLAFPDDLLRVRLYRHEGHAFDGVWQLDAAHAPQQGTLVASVGMDGRARLLHLDETDLMPYRRKDYASRLYAIMALRAGAGAGAGAGQRLGCDLAWRGARLVQEQTEVSPKGDVTVPLRASLTAVRLVPVPFGGGGGGGGGDDGVKGQPQPQPGKRKRTASEAAGVRPIVIVGSFSGLCRLVDVGGRGLA